MNSPLVIPPQSMLSEYMLGEFSSPNKQQPPEAAPDTHQEEATKSRESREVLLDSAHAQASKWGKGDRKAEGSLAAMTWVKVSLPLSGPRKVRRSRVREMQRQGQRERGGEWTERENYHPGHIALRKWTSQNKTQAAACEHECMWR